MFKIQVEVNGTNIVVEATNTLNMGGLNAFIDSMGNKEQAPKVATKAPVKKTTRGRGRPAGVKNKRK
jgi:hypothetical protein